MKKFIFPAFALFFGLSSLLLVNAPLHAGTTSNTAVLVKMETTMGEVILEVYPDKAPRTVKNFLSYINAGAYNGTIFHRVMKGFMNQGGGFNTGYIKTSTKDPVANEAFNGLKNKRGTIAMARTGEPHSATKQFFINTVDNAFLNHTGKTMRGWGYAVFGKVTQGMNVMDEISKVSTGSAGPFASDVPLQQIIITKMSVIK